MRALRPRRLRPRARRLPGRHRAERERQDDAAPACRGAGGADARRAGGCGRRGGLGYLGHEPLVYRDLTALENLDLYGRLYRVPERRERIGMLLERFGLWDARAQARLGVFTRDDAAARAVPCAPPRARAARARRAVSRRSTARVQTCSTASSSRLVGDRTLVVSTHDVERLAPLATAQAGSRMSYSRLTSRRSRGRISVSSCGRGTRCRRCCSSSSRRSSSSTSRCRPAPATTLPTACSGSRSSSRRCSVSARAWVPEREGAALDGLVLAPCDRSAIWLGQDARDPRVPRRCVEIVALPAFAFFFAPLGRERLCSASRSRTSGSAPSARSLPRWRPPAATRELILPLALPAARDPARSSAASARASPARRDVPVFLVLYDALFSILSWASFEYVVTE